MIRCNATRFHLPANALADGLSLPKLRNGNSQCPLRSRIIWMGLDQTAVKGCAELFYDLELFF